MTIKRIRYLLCSLISLGEHFVLGVLSLRDGHFAIKTASRTLRSCSRSFPFVVCWMSSLTSSRVSSLASSFLAHRLTARVGRARSVAAHLFRHHRAYRAHTIALRLIALPRGRQAGVRSERPRIAPNRPYSVLQSCISTGLSNFNVPDSIEQSCSRSTTIRWI